MGLRPKSLKTLRLCLCELPSFVHREPARTYFFVGAGPVTMDSKNGWFLSRSNQKECRADHVDEHDEASTPSTLPSLQYWPMRSMKHSFQCDIKVSGSYWLLWDPCKVHFVKL